ncbi:MAG: hypothetical protein GY820_25780 [Gammaproteobacteria bacterium]|nr:hypothetical protein [Gammaproteobacteria bacterium]
MSDILQQMDQLKARLDKVKKYTHQKMLLKQRVPVTNPDSHVEGEVAVQTYDREVADIKFLEAISHNLSSHFNKRSQALCALLVKLCTRFTVPFPASMTKEQGDVLTVISSLKSRNIKIWHESLALEEAGKITDQHTPELGMEFHELCQEVSEFMEFHGVTTSKPKGEELRQLREKSVSSSSSAVMSQRDDTAGSSLNAPNSIEIGENISTPTPQTFQGTVEQSREFWPQSNHYSQPPFQNR